MSAATALLRAALPSDAADLARLHALGFEDGWTEADFRGWLERPDAFAVLAEAEGEIRAFGLALGAGDDVELLTITTRPDLRGKQLGARVLAHLEQEAASHGFSRWVLEAATDNAPALALYRRDGFVEIGRRKGYYPRPGTRCDALIMARAVRPQGL